MVDAVGALRRGSEPPTAKPDHPAILTASKVAPRIALARARHLQRARQCRRRHFARGLGRRVDCCEVHL
eukprot:15294525-Alexandrium_andersonii.AAC.1